MIFSTLEGTSKLEVKRFSTARTTPSLVLIPIAVVPSYIKKGETSKLKLACFVSRLLLLLLLLCFSRSDHHTYLYGLYRVLDLKDTSLGAEAVDAPVVLVPCHKHDETTLSSKKSIEKERKNNNKILDPLSPRRLSLSLSLFLLSLSSSSLSLNPKNLFFGVNKRDDLIGETERNVHSRSNVSYHKHERTSSRLLSHPPWGRTQATEELKLASQGQGGHGLLQIKLFVKLVPVDLRWHFSNQERGVRSSQRCSLGHHHHHHNQHRY